MNIDETRAGWVAPAAHIVGRGFRSWLYAAAALGMMAAVFDPATALGQADACPNKGGTLTFARSADVSGWYYQDNNPTIWAWPLVSLALVRNKVDAIHKKLAKWLCENYSVVLLPKFETSKLVTKSMRKINSKTAVRCTRSRGFPRCATCPIGASRSRHLNFTSASIVHISKA